MKNKSARILNTLIETLRKTHHYFGDIACAEMSGINFAMADIAMKKNNETEVYRVIVVKHSNLIIQTDT